MAAAEPVATPLRRTLESTLMATSRAMRRAYDARLADLGLKLSEAFLLGHVHSHGPLTQTQLAEGLGIGRAATGSLIDALERKGLVERAADATERAGPVVAELAAVDVALREALWTGIGRAERRQLSETLLRLQDNLAAILNEQM
jgi:MarR family transcriptional regulator, transcriptional regulator for hemolysin